MKLTLQKTLFIITLFINTQVQAMGLFDFFTIYVFSDMQGIVTLKGEPVAGAKVTRIGDHENDKVYTDSAITDAQGHFSFEPISTFSLRPMMLGTIIRQKITIEHEGQEYLAWETKKKNDHIYGELNSKDSNAPQKIDLLCELTSSQDDKKVLRIDFRNVAIKGLCQWKGLLKEG